MADNRFKDFPTDYRFPEPGVDVRFATPGADARFLDGVDTRFEGSSYGGAEAPAALFAASEPGAWVDPSDLSTMFQDAGGTVPVAANGDPLALTLDKSGNGNSVTWTNATYGTDGTLHWINYNGSTTRGATPTITPNTDKAQVFAGARKLSDAARGTIINQNSTTAPSFTISAPLADGQLSYAAQMDNVSANAAGFAAPTTNVVTGLFDRADVNHSTLRVDGSVASTQNAAISAVNFGAFPLFIGRRSSGVGGFNGRLYSLIARFGPNLDAATIGAVEAYVAGKTGVTL